MSPGEAEENHENFLLGQAVAGPRFEAGASKICLEPYRYIRQLGGRSHIWKYWYCNMAQICLILCASIYLASGLGIQ